jgi:hypothetical protein
MRLTYKRYGRGRFPDSRGIELCLRLGRLYFIVDLGKIV